MTNNNKHCLHCIAKDKNTFPLITNNPYLLHLSYINNEQQHTLFLFTSG